MISSVGSTPVEAPAVVQTHVSTLFFYGDRVLKLRRPVSYAFIDFGLLSSRRDDCEREVQLNSRLAPDVYLGTAALSTGKEPIEYGVLMRGLPAKRSLERLMARPTLVAALPAAASRPSRDPLA